LTFSSSVRSLRGLPRGLFGLSSVFSLRGLPRDRFTTSELLSLGLGGLPLERFTSVAFIASSPVSWETVSVLQEDEETEGEVEVNDVAEEVEETFSFSEFLGGLPFFTLPSVVSSASTKPSWIISSIAIFEAWNQYGSPFLSLLRVLSGVF
jgi:hypothetical protein